MGMCKAVILDLFGTLVHLRRNSQPYLRFARAVRPDDPAGVLRAALVTDALSLGAFAEFLGAPPPGDLSRLEADLGRDVRSAALYADVPAALAGLRAGGMRLGLLSNLATPYKAAVDRLGLGAFFESAVFSCDVGLCKPWPEIYHKVAEDMGLSPGEILMVGDSLRSDYDGSKSVGMKATLLKRDGTTATAPASIRSLAELPARIALAALPDA